MKSTVTTEIVYRNKVTNEVSLTIPVGTKITINFDQNGGTSTLTIDDSNITKKVSLSTLIKKCTGFTKMPSEATMERWMFDGVAKSITGKRVEPDGFGEDGSPSWLVALGLI